jgi:hypothetical protein
MRWLVNEATADRKWARRALGNGDVFDYDLNDQATAMKLNVPNAESTPAGTPTIIYDWNGNGSWFTPYGSNNVTNNLNQYTSRNTINADYNTMGT